MMNSHGEFMNKLNLQCSSLNQFMIHMLQLQDIMVNIFMKVGTTSLGRKEVFGCDCES
jgi:hypothetical protein